MYTTYVHSSWALLKSRKILFRSWLNSKVRLHAITSYVCAHINTLYIHNFNVQMQSIDQCYNLLKMFIRIGNISRRKKNKSNNLERFGIQVGSIPSVINQYSYSASFFKWAWMWNQVFSSFLFLVANKRIRQALDRIAWKHNRSKVLSSSSQEISSLDTTENCKVLPACKIVLVN